MGLLDELMKSGGLGAIANTVTSNPQVLQAVLSLLSNREGSIGGPGRPGRPDLGVPEQGSR